MRKSYNIVGLFTDLIKGDRTTIQLSDICFPTNPTSAIALLKLPKSTILRRYCCLILSRALSL
ncbi:hypothetical protein [Nostoc sp. CHAB 5715]|uniref:hypothetical protein n=1 Tax=Nostoc sp. CHAB 5715 TaxID=2780400 RepID=UPI001E3AC4E3|nr:hypothetical protein [Nostoc sp. CHAB 5715]MCC5625877.1 hypothetical protein [Nostoc sp. CHAB 5715]